jgi:hypothetical protein
MAKGNEIIVSSDPRGVFMEGIIGDTSKPGTLMQIQAGTAPKAGRFTWIAASIGTDGKASLIAVLLPDSLQGKLATDAYVSGTRCFLYCPEGGEDLNVLVGEGAGTSNTFAIGDRFTLDSDVGILIPAAGTEASQPFICLETFTQVTSPQLVWCKYTDH